MSWDDSPVDVDAPLDPSLDRTVYELTGAIVRKDYKNLPFKGSTPTIYIKPIDIVKQGEKIVLVRMSSIPNQFGNDIHPKQIVNQFRHDGELNICIDSIFIKKFQGLHHEIHKRTANHERMTLLVSEGAAYFSAFSLVGLVPLAKGTSNASGPTWTSDRIYMP
jgi:hypothetical protein